MGKIVITGASSDIGLAIARRLGGLGLPLLLQCRSHADRLDGLEAEVVRADFADREELKRFVAKLQDVEILVNAAADTQTGLLPQLEDADIDRMLAVNVAATTFLAEACGSERELLYLSSDYVFGSDGDAPLETADKKAPRGVYAQSKYAGELAVEQLCPRRYIVRTSWVFGEQDRNFIAAILRLAQTHQTLRVVADQIGAPTYSRHLAVYTHLAHSYQLLRLSAGGYAAIGKKFLQSDTIVIRQNKPSQFTENQSLFHSHFFRH